MSYTNPTDLTVRQGAPQGVGGNDYRNPLTEDMYLYMEEAYLGSGGFKDGKYLVPNPVETKNDYIERKNTAYYRNFVKKVLRALINPVFTNTPKRKLYLNNDVIEHDKLNAFLQSANLTGDSIKDVVKNIVEMGIVYGMNIYGVENFSQEVMSNSERENIENRHFPYVFNIKPYSIDEVALDDGGNIVGVGYFIGKRKISDKETDVFRWYEYGLTYEYYKKDDGIIERFNDTEIELPTMPVDFCYWTKRSDKDTWQVHPDFYDIVRVNTAVYNVDSLRMRNVRKQGFSILAVHEMRGGLKVAPGMYINMSSEAKSEPRYISPDSSINKELREEVNDLIQSLVTLAEQKGVVGVQSSQSGVAKEWDFRALSSTLDKVADFAEEIEKKIVDLFFAWNGEKGKYTYNVQYNRDYQPDSEKDVLSLVQDYLDLQPAPENRTIAMQAAAKTFAVKYAPEQQEEMLKYEEDYNREIRQDGNEGGFE